MSAIQTKNITNNKDQAFNKLSNDDIENVREIAIKEFKLRCELSSIIDIEISTIADKLKNEL